MDAKWIVKIVKMKCNHVERTFGSMYPDGESIYYEFTCDICGATGREYYDLEYVETVMDEVDTVKGYMKDNVEDGGMPNNEMGSG